jgi:signal transduction histidine kinase
VDVPLLLGELEAEWRVRVQRAGSELRTEAPPGLQVEGDAQLIRRVLGNLVGNALVHGGIPVNVEVVAEALPDDEGVRIEVSDDGVGIADAFHDVIFRKFGSVRNPEERSSRSWGLGLAFCRLAVEAHGGRIWVESREGEGSSFRFTLPRHPQPRPPRF